MTGLEDWPNETSRHEASLSLSTKEQHINDMETDIKIPPRKKLKVACLPFGNSLLKLVAELAATPT